MSADAVTVLWSFIGALVVSVAILVGQQIRIQSSLDRIQRKITSLGAELQDINKRLIDVETDQATEPPPMRETDDLLGAPQSWLSQAARAERYEGVRG